MQFGLIGRQLGHSFSKELHGKIGNYQYDLLELEPEQLARFFRERNFKGINVTVPYKEKVLSFLDVMSDTAQNIGAVNTVVNVKGKLFGDNTDFVGFKSLLCHNKFNVKNKKVLVLGTGGTSKTVTAVLNFFNCENIIKVSHSGVTNAVSYDDVYLKHSDADFIVNTTPVGMFADMDCVPLDISKFANLQGVADVIYNPLRTDLQLAAMGKKIKYCGGLYMLAAQAVYASALFQNIKPDAMVVKKVYLELLTEKQNIVLTGMPSCGKSSVGKCLAAKLKRNFVDTDVLLAGKLGCRVDDFLKNYGESEFRKRETNIIKEISMQNGIVIATGGGAVLNGQNIKNLKHNGVVFFLDRDFNLLQVSSDRPLSDNKTKLQKMFEDRYLVYKNSADICLDGNGGVEETANLILKEWRRYNENISD